MVPGARASFATGGGPDKRSYQVDCSKIERELPGFEARWTVRRGVEQLYDAYVRDDLTLEEFTGTRYLRINRIRELQEARRLDGELRWRRAGRRPLIVPALRRLLPSAATDSFLPVGEASRARGAQPPTDVPRHEIERSLKRGSLWALGSQVAVQAIRFAGVVVLARLLSPDDYGLAAIAVTIGAYSGSSVISDTAWPWFKRLRLRSAGRRLRVGAPWQPGRSARDWWRLGPIRWRWRWTSQRSAP